MSENDPAATVATGIVGVSRDRIAELKLPFSLFLALRYLKPKQADAAIRLDPEWIANISDL